MEGCEREEWTGQNRAEVVGSGGQGLVLYKWLRRNECVSKQRSRRPCRIEIAGVRCCLCWVERRASLGRRIHSTGKPDQ